MLRKNQSSKISNHTLTFALAILLMFSSWKSALSSEVKLGHPGGMTSSSIITVSEATPNTFWQGSTTITVCIPNSMNGSIFKFVVYYSGGSDSYTIKNSGEHQISVTPKASAPRGTYYYELVDNDNEPIAGTQKSFSYIDNPN